MKFKKNATIPVGTKDEFDTYAFYRKLIDIIPCCSHEPMNIQ